LGKFTAAHLICLAISVANFQFFFFAYGCEGFSTWESIFSHLRLLSLRMQSSEGRQRKLRAVTVAPPQTLLSPTTPVFLAVPPKVRRSPRLSSASPFSLPGHSGCVVAMCVSLFLSVWSKPFRAFRLRVMKRFFSQALCLIVPPSAPCSIVV